MNNRNSNSTIALRNKSPNLFARTHKYVNHFRSWFRDFLDNAE